MDTRPSTGLALFCVLLLLLGVTCYTDDCSRKISECSVLLGTSVSDSSTMPDVSYLEAHCRSLETCIAAARTMCNTTLTSGNVVNDLQSAADIMCSTDIICMLKVTACEADLYNSGFQNRVEEGQDLTESEIMCPKYPRVVECLEDVAASEQCREQDTVKDVTAAVSLSASVCDTECWEVLPCFTPLAAITKALNCSVFSEMMKCLDDAETKCDLDKSQISFSDLARIATALCEELWKFPEFVDCNALTQCMLTSVIPKELLAKLQKGNGDETGVIGSLDELTKMYASHFSPQFACKSLGAVTACSISNVDVCSLNDDFKTSMIRQQENLKKSKCLPDSGAKAPSVTVSVTLFVAVLQLWWSLG